MNAKQSGAHKACWNGAHVTCQQLSSIVYVKSDPVPRLNNKGSAQHLLEYFFNCQSILPVHWKREKKKAAMTNLLQ